MQMEMSLFGTPPPLPASASPGQSLYDVITEAAIQNRLAAELKERKDSVGSDKLSTRYKTELCRAYQDTGLCKYADKCQFAHGAKELREVPRHPKYKTELCRCFHASGFCTYGKRCHFVHDLEESRRPILEILEKATFPLPPKLAQFLAVKQGKKNDDWFVPTSPQQSPSPRCISPMFNGNGFNSPSLNVPSSPKTPKTPYSAVSMADDVFSFSSKSIFTTGKASPDSMASSTSSNDSGLGKWAFSPNFSNASIFQFPEVTATPKSQPNDWTSGPCSSAFPDSTWSNDTNANTTLTTTPKDGAKWVLSEFVQSHETNNVNINAADSIAEPMSPWMDLLKDF